MERHWVTVATLRGDWTDPVPVGDEACDVLLLRDASEGDEEREAVLDVIQEICRVTDVPVVATGEIRRMEDVKKLLYAGCDRVALDGAALRDGALCAEVVGKFGKDRLAALLPPGTAPFSGEAASRGLASLCPVGDGAGPSGRAEYLLDGGIAREPLTAAISWEELKKGPEGLVPVVVQDDRTEEVLMVAYMDEEAYRHTIATGRMTYHSRSRGTQWVKGETSGHFQYVRSLTADCDLDTILARVKQVGSACHTGARSCFFNEIARRAGSHRNPQRVLEDVYAVIQDRRLHPREGSYTNYLFDKGIDKILKKCGEEATEIVIAAKNPNGNEIVYELSDFLYHAMVLMVEKGVTWEDVTDELARR